VVIKQTIIITGGTRGIGAAISRTFHEEGAYILLAGRNDNGLAESLGKRARFQQADVRNQSDHQALVKTALRWTGRLDVYINCAGLSEWRSLDEADEAFWDRVIDTNLKGTFWGCKAAAEHMGKGGCIINISSLAGKRGSANNSVYCASKFGVNGLTQALAKELGTKGIRVNAVCPVYVYTDGLLKALADEKSPSQGKDIDSFLREFAIKDSALCRIPTSEEIAQVCIFLASPQASAITGQCINVDCGVLPQ
jgi:3-oxoacyl-[acyl-carrier protein] reductase/meso-butanediol dehydrogenase/(S,S)-butanediol dehydrogenase/diacetyl reductase